MNIHVSFYQRENGTTEGRLHPCKRWREQTGGKDGGNRDEEEKSQWQGSMPPPPKKSLLRHVKEGIL